jgi:hypothetical protein
MIILFLRGAAEKRNSGDVTPEPVIWRALQLLAGFMPCQKLLLD